MSLEPLFFVNEIHFTSPITSQLKLCLGDGVLFSTYAQLIKSDLLGGWLGGPSNFVLHRIL